MYMHSHIPNIDCLRKMIWGVDQSIVQGIVYTIPQTPHKAPSEARDVGKHMYILNVCTNIVSFREADASPQCN